jgi:uncharacterized protein (DUF1330 family)
MRKPFHFVRTRSAAVLGIAMGASALVGSSFAQKADRPAFVIVERLATTGPESIQGEYGKLARDILPKYGARYLARSQNNILLEGDSAAPCCIAILQFPNLDAAKRWYGSAENQSAAKIRQGGGRFRLVAVDGLASPQ